MAFELFAFAAVGDDVEGTLDFQLEDLGGEWLGDEVEGSEFHGFDGGFDGAIAGDDHEEGVRVEAADGFEHGDAIHAFHLEVADDKVCRVL
jgi:hypothetical protein